MDSQRKNKKKKLLTVLFVLLNIAVIAYIAFSEFGGGVKPNSEPQLNKYWYLYILGALVCFAVLVLAETTKYVYMMKALGQKISWRTAFETAALGKYYDCITPSGIGGQPFQIYWLHKRGYSDGASSSMTITGFVTMQLAFILVAFTVFVTWRSVEVEPIRYIAYAGLLAYCVLPFVVIAFSYKPKAIEKLISGIIHLGGKIHLVKDPDRRTAIVLGKIIEFNDNYKIIARNKRSVAILLFLAVIYQIALCSIAYFIIIAFGSADSYMHIFAATVYIYATASVIATPGNSGAMEGVFYIVFSAIGSDGVFWAMLVWRLISYYLFIAQGGVIFAYNAIAAKKQKKRK